jgi:hypothetical protein
MKEMRPTLIVDVHIDGEGTLDSKSAAQESGQPLGKNHELKAKGQGGGGKEEK